MYVTNITLQISLKQNFSGNLYYIRVFKNGVGNAEYTSAHGAVKLDNKHYYIM